MFLDAVYWDYVVEQFCMWTQFPVYTSTRLLKKSLECFHGNQTISEKSYVFIGSWFLDGEWAGSLYMTDMESLRKQE
jgi:hypothetical protein